MTETKQLTLTQPVDTSSRNGLAQWAITNGANTEQLAILLDTQLKWEANEARKAFILAMETFKRNPPDINKTKLVSFPNKDGNKTQYYHAELDKITDLIGAELLKVGITHSWRTSSTDGKITVTCVLKHTLGHCEDVATLSGPSDQSGGKNNIQAIGSTTTYLQRYTLLAGVGLAAKGTDDDGKIEGMTEDAITDYCVQMQDSANLEELQKVFTEAWNKAKALGDMQAQGRFRKVKDERKKEFHV